MTKQDFIALADTLRPHWQDMATEAKSDIIRFCRSRNPRFMPDRFIGYIEGRNGPNGGPKK